MCKITDKEIDNFYGEYEKPTPLGDRLYSNSNHNLRRNIKMVKKDCFGFRKSRCNILTEMVCRYGECSFYKTHEQDKADREKYRLKQNYQPRMQS